MTPPLSVYITIILERDDHRAIASLAHEAKSKELAGILPSGRFNLGTKDEAEKSCIPKIIGGRFVITFKYKTTKNDIYSDRFVVQGYNDIEKKLFIQSTTTISYQYVRLLIPVATTFGFRI